MENRIFAGFAKCVRSLPCLLAFSAVLAVTAHGRAEAPAAASGTAQAVPEGKTPPEVLDGRATLVSHYDPSKMLRLAIVLVSPHPAEEHQFLEDVQNKESPLFHRFLSPEECTARFSPSKEDEQAVVDWAISQGLTITYRFPNRLLVDVEAPAGVIEKALHLTINQYRLPIEEGEEEGRIAFSNDRDPELPATLQTIVMSVQGLNSIELMRPANSAGPLVPEPDYVPGPEYQATDSVQRDANPEPVLAERAEASAISPEVVPPPPSGFGKPSDYYSSKAYDYQALMNQGHCCNPLGARTAPPETAIAIAAFGDVAINDITVFANAFGLAISVQKLSIGGFYTCNNTAKAVDINCGETTLDTDWSMATANTLGSADDTAKVYIYEGSSISAATTISVYNHILSDDQARVMSTSWSCAESTASGSTGCTKDTITARDTVLAKMVAQGWTLVGDSADQGATRLCTNALLVAFPSGDPNVVGVGGTSLNEGTVSSNYEVAWTGNTATGSCAGNNGGSTGGFSILWPAPSYQSFLGFTKRAVPDIALDATHGHDIYIAGQWVPAGGTSVAAPMMAGFFAQENAYLRSLGGVCGKKGESPCGPLGNANYPIYAEGQLKDAEHTPFYDITSGCNSNDITALYKLTAYCAGPGYDEVTGWGSANMLQLAWAINQHLTAAVGRPYITFSGPEKNKWFNINQILTWTVNDFPGEGFPATIGTGIAGFTQAWDTAPKDRTTEAHGGTGNLFYSGPQFPNATTGCLSFTGEGGCEGGLSQGCHTAYVHGWNNQGKSTTGQPDFPESYGPVCFDNVPPIVSISDSPAANPQGWNNKPVTVTIDATDPGNIEVGKIHVIRASGIKNIYFGINNRCATTNIKGCGVYGRPFTLGKDGIYTILFFAEDKAGNFGLTTKGYERVMLDQIPPVTTVHITGTLSGGVYTSPVGLVLGATDATSGVKYTEYKLDGGPVTYYSIGSSQTIPVSAPGSHTFKYWGTDFAGNVETAHTLTFTISNATQVTLTATPNPALLGQAVMINATVTNPKGAIPQGTVTFKADGTNVVIETLVNGAVQGVSDNNLTTGSHVLTATYSPTAGPAITSTAVTEVVGAVQDTLISLVSSANPSVSGSPVTFTAIVRAAISGIPTGNVTFMDGTKVLGAETYTYPSATYTTSSLSVGTHSITAVYSGDSKYGASTSAVLSQVVNSGNAMK
jgi:hypothetical protein